MKMICPHCGVKGSADQSLLQRKVKCPKCSGIFEVNAEVVTAIPVDDFELEPVSDVDETQDDPALEENVDGAFDDLFGDKETSSVDEMEESALDKLLAGADEEEHDDDLVAALHDSDEESMSDPMAAEDVDSTLTVIEDIPEEAMGSGEQQETEEDSLVMDDDSLAFESDQIDWDQEEQRVEEVPDDPDDVLDFEDDIQLEGEEEGVAVDQHRESEQEEELSLNDFDDDSEEEIDIWAEDPDDAKELFDDYPSPETEDEQDDLKENVDTEADEERNGSELSVVDEIVEDEEELELTAEEAEAELEDEGEEVEVAEEVVTPREKGDNVIQKCSACGEYVDQNAKYKLGSNVYCDKCVPRREKKNGPLEDSEILELAAAASAAAYTEEKPQPAINEGKFSLSTLIKDAWRYTKGVKGSIWAAFGFMYMVLFAIGFASAFILPFALTGQSPLNATLINFGLQIVIGILSYVLTAGIFVIAINRIGGKPFSWKLVFSGFKKTGSLTLLYFLQIIMIIIGFCLFVIPGIYLIVGYILSIPLVMVKGLSPWQALEESRKAIHTRWWTVFFSLVVMGILVMVSMIPLGIGLIWTIPMFMVLIGILYYHFFSDEEGELATDER